MLLQLENSKNVIHVHVHTTKSHEKLLVLQYVHCTYICTCVAVADDVLRCVLQQLLDITRSLLEEPQCVLEEMHKLQQLKAVLEM